MDRRRRRRGAWEQRRQQTTFERRVDERSRRRSDQSGGRLRIWRRSFIELGTISSPPPSPPPPPLLEEEEEAFPSGFSCEMKMLTTVSQSNAQLRKIKKPLIERRRRERINECLCQLKTLVLEATNRDESCYSKMEKADILEMTVSHLRSVQRHPTSSPTSSPVTSSNRDDAVTKYLYGFNECAKEVAKYLSGVEELADSVVSGLMKHLTVRFGHFHRLPSETQFPSKQSLYAEVDENSNLLVTPVLRRRLVPELSESLSSAMSSLNRADLFCEAVSLSVPTSSEVVSSSHCPASVAARCGARDASSGSSGSVEQRAELTRHGGGEGASTSHGQSPYLSSADGHPRRTQQWGLMVVPPHQSLPFAVVMKRSERAAVISKSSSVAASPSAAVIPVMSPEVENAVKNEILLSGSIWRPW